MSSDKLTEAVKEIHWWKSLAEEAEKEAIEEGLETLAAYHEGRVRMAESVLRLLRA